MISILRNTKVIFYEIIIRTKSESGSQNSLVISSFSLVENGRLGQVDLTQRQIHYHKRDTDYAEKKQTMLMVSIINSVSIRFFETCFLLIFNYIMTFTTAVSITTKLGLGETNVH